MSLLQNEKLEELRNLGIEEIEVLLDHISILTNQRDIARMWCEYHHKMCNWRELVLEIAQQAHPTWSYQEPAPITVPSMPEMPHDHFCEGDSWSGLLSY